MSSESAKRGPGRPRKENPRNVEVRVRLTREEYDWLAEYAEANDVTMSDILRAGIFMSDNNIL